jgi:glycosidase
MLVIAASELCADDQLKQTLAAADTATVHVTLSPQELIIEYQAPEIDLPGHGVYVALDTDPSSGCAVLPFAQQFEGSTVFLPFGADKFLFTKITNEKEGFSRDWARTMWSERVQKKHFATTAANTVKFVVSRQELGTARTVGLVVYAKDLTENNGWGRMYGAIDGEVRGGIGDKYVPHYYEIALSASQTPIATLKARHGTEADRVRIYQLLVRLFSNTNETRKPNGTLAENGVSKFAHINETALNSLKEMGITHIWLTGVLQQATATDYSETAQPADDPDLLKGLAGSPYAIKDYFDVCPDYADDPAQRIQEFKALVDRIHQHGMRVLIDLVPNHVARSYNSDIKSDLNFGGRGRGGVGDDVTKFFEPQNNFFYLQRNHSGGGPPLRLPTFKDGKAISPTCMVSNLPCDGLFDQEREHGRVTGNNVVSWVPNLGDWYETVKLNYGYDFTDQSKRTREYPQGTSDKPIPDTWQKIDGIIAYWQELGVDGFRCDMAHMVPPEFWSWAVGRARGRNSKVFFVAEAYDGDPAKVLGGNPIIAELNSGKGNVMFDLLSAGFDAVYDDPAYDTIKNIYDGSAWANDIDQAFTDNFIFQNSLRYAENHDEVRLAAKGHWGEAGMEAGRPVSAILCGVSRGPVMLYNGQEVGEPAAGAEGFGGDDGRTSIFDYWSMPELVKWVNEHKYDGGRLTDAQKNLRGFYSKLLHLVNEPAFRAGTFYPLNPANNKSANFGTIGQEPASGHWMYAFLRYDPKTQQRYLVVSNLHKTETLQDVQLRIPKELLTELHIDKPDAELTFVERLSTNGALTLKAVAQDLNGRGLQIPEVPPLTPYYFEIAVP